MLMSGRTAHRFSRKAQFCDGRHRLTRWCRGRAPAGRNRSPISSKPLPSAALAIDNIRGKIADLHQLGFADPVKMITSSTPILGLAIDNIRAKIADLRE